MRLSLGLASETGDKGVSVSFARLNRYESRSRLVCETLKGFSLGLAHKYWSCYSVSQDPEQIWIPEQQRRVWRKDTVQSAGTEEHGGKKERQD